MAVLLRDCLIVPVCIRWRCCWSLRWLWCGP